MVWIMGLLVKKKKELIWGIIALICVFSCIYLYCCCGICLQCSQIATEGDTSTLMKPFADHPGYAAKEGT